MISLSDLAPGDQLRADVRVAAVGGLIAAAAMSALVLAVGSLSAFEAKVLLQAALPTIRVLCSSVMVASATTLALILTLVSLTAGVEREVKGTHYTRIRQVARLDVVAFVGSTLLLVALIVPVGEAGEIPTAWYTGIYYASSLLSAALGGILVSVMLLLYAAARDLIGVLGPGEGGSLLVDPDDDGA